ncbi:alkene reductase [Glutamicibacter halophytocola]|uniref:alkene reductase n=1 Tax=Glutamicibacter halophytocola TaxID=1933880 RepID=UPI0015C52B3D|nr:alkene reductase [Glutamicibacter halophytocola]NQD40501.1 alkene reductase [Glutamicibacter halophytocola]
MSESSLFSPVYLGDQHLENRIALPPLTRSRANPDGTATALMREYYAQRSGAGLVIAEGTVVSPQASAYANVPGLFNKEQVMAWRPVVEAAKRDGNAVYCQLWHVGRQSHSSVQPDGQPPFGPSAIPIKGFTYRSTDGRIPYETPRELTQDGIHEIVQAFGSAAANARDAGFDGVELHAANGYLIEQFLDDGINQRTDEYGGSLENRLRFLFEVLNAVIKHIPANRVGIRFSPSSDWMDAIDSDKRTLFSTVIQRLNSYSLAYLHLVEPGISGATNSSQAPDATPTKELASLFNGTVIATGGHTKESAEELISSGVVDLVGFGRKFIANPDLPERFRQNAPLAELAPHGLYSGGEHGYTDYPALDSCPS